MGLQLEISESPSLSSYVISLVICSSNQQSPGSATMLRGCATLLLSARNILFCSCLTVRDVSVKLSQARILLVVQATPVE
jgi:hypothetical protein